MSSLSDSGSHHSTDSHPTTDARRTRGLTTMSKWKGKRITLTEEDFDELKNPKGKGGKGFRNYIGVVARSKVNINYSDWRYVDDGLKDMIWDDIKTTCSLPEDADLKQKIIKVAGFRVRNFKKRLADQWIKRKVPRKDTPMEMYNFITAEDWEIFKKKVQSPEFEKISEKAKESQSHNLYPHRLGAAGYAGMREVWEKNDPISYLSSSGSVDDHDLKTNRSWDYLRARVGVKDGKVLCGNGVSDLFDKMVEKSREVKEGTFIPDRHHDVLSAVLGKEDHPGRPRTFGSYTSGLREVFGKPKSKSRNRSADSDDLDSRVAQEVQTQLNAEFDSRVQQRVVETLIQLGIQVPSTIMTNTRLSSTDSVCPATTSADPFTALTESTNCTLFVEMQGQTIQVAEGICYPITTDILVHGCPLDGRNVKVRVDMVPDCYKLYSLPVPVRDDLVTVGDAKGSFVQWPKHLVCLENANKVLKKKVPKVQPKAQSFQMSTNRNSIVDEATYKSLPPSCKSLVDLVALLPSDDMLDVPLDASLFPSSDEDIIYVGINDIADIMTMDWLNVPVLQVFSMYLHRLCTTYEVPIGFLNPSLITPTMIQTDSSIPTGYLGKAIYEMRDCKYILAPYFQQQHWLLLVVEPATNTIYVMDSLSGSKRKLEITPIISVGFKMFWNLGGRRTSRVNWVHLPCTQQPGSNECGYCVMKNMQNICSGNDIRALDVREYSQTDIDAVRETWCDFFREVM